MKIITRFAACSSRNSSRSPPARVRARHTAAPQPQQNVQATDALRRGATAQRGRADEALPLLEAALKLYAVSGSTRGQAAAPDALGDPYARQGQPRAPCRTTRRRMKKFATPSARPTPPRAADALTRRTPARRFAKFIDAASTPT